MFLGTQSWLAIEPRRYRKGVHRSPEHGTARVVGELFQALFWPAFMVYDVFAALGG
jgi:hypothetical protein